jgi:hypothetical protein
MKMSRRRCTTAKMYSGNKPGGPKRPSQSRASIVDSTDGHADDGTAAEKGKTLTAETLASHLAVEALLRDSSEKRTASAIKRYFRLTVALAGINLLVAGTTVFALWSRPGRRLEPALLPPTPAAAQSGCASAAPARAPATVPAPASGPAAAVPSVLPAAVPPKAILPLPPSPSDKRETSGTTARSRRPAARIRVVHNDSDEVETVALDSAVERW